MHLTRTQILWSFIAIVGLLRLLSLAMYPLMDTTEARYGEIARIMAETGNWITPQFDYGVPFWGKPPLYTWLSSFSILLLGNSEFNLRLPHFLSAILVLLLIWKFSIHLKMSRIQATYTIAIVTTTVGFLFSAGIIMTDMLLCLSMTMSMIGFWRGWHGDQAYFYLMNIGISIGLLAKGPLVLVLFFLALLPWLASQYGIVKMWKELWTRLNIFTGGAIIILISLPWYILAERASPGFLQYFIEGEHFQRFIDSGWNGDLYGSAHEKIRGTIWLYWFIFALPWSPVVIWGLTSAFYKKNSIRNKDNGLNFFLLAWISSPLILFTFAGNILPAYVLPGLPAIGLLIVINHDVLQLKKGNLVFLFTPLLFLIILGTIHYSVAENRSEKALLSNNLNSVEPIYYYKNRPFSAQYYTNGKALKIKALPTTTESYYLAIRKKEISEIDKRRCHFRSENKYRVLYYCQALKILGHKK